MVDKYPQWMNFTLGVLSSTTIVVTETNTPKLGENEAMEVLKAEYEIEMPTFASAAAVSADQSNELQVSLVQGSDPGIVEMVNINQKACIDKLRLKDESVFAEVTETGGGPFRGNSIYVHDFTDGSGRGFLVSSEKFYQQIRGSNANMVGTIRSRILYKAAKVSPSELLQLSRQ